MHDLNCPLELPVNVVELDDLAMEIWNYYFRPKETLASHERKQLMARYNTVAKKRNELSGFKALIFLTPSTRVEFVDEAKLMRPPGVGAPAKLNFVPPTVSNDAPKIQGGAIIQQIIAHYIAGKSNKEIISLGFNKSTVARQVGEYKKRQTVNNG